MRTATGASLTNEDMLRFRAFEARSNAIKANASAYSRDEIETHELRGFAMLGEFVERYGLDDGRPWIFSPYTGTIWYTEDD